jgi:hypothetical protein
MVYGIAFFARPEDRATLGSDPSAVTGPNTHERGVGFFCAPFAFVLCGSAASGKPWGFGGNAPTLTAYIGR